MMPRVYKPAGYIHKNIRVGNWLGLSYDAPQQQITCSAGEILTFSDGKYTLTFQAFSNTDRRYFDLKQNYQTLIFPNTLKINDYLFFRGNTGNYKLSHDKIFKNIINPRKRKIEKIVIVEDDSVAVDYDSTNYVLTISILKFREAMAAAAAVFSKTKSYSNSAENYLTNQESKRFTKDIKAETTTLQKGELKFAVDRLNLPTKRNKATLQKYVNDDDVASIETLTEQMLRLEVFSETFIRKINDYFIKERLQDIIKIGRDILDLGTTDLSTDKAQKVIQQVDYKYKGKGSLEALWQEYFRKYLLFLIFSYKKIFPKIELTDVEGDKKYPDFIGINHYNGLDVIEIKTHLAEALKWDKSHKNFYFSPEISKAIIQSKNYMDSIIRERFKNTSDRTRITQSTENENIYHPRAIIIISSKERLTLHKGDEAKLTRDFTKLRNGLHDIEVLTFSEILDIADEYIKNISEE